MDGFDRQQRGGRSKPWVLVTVIALLVAGWILAVLLMGGDEDTPPSADGVGEEAETTQPSDTAAEDWEGTTEDGLAQGPAAEDEQDEAEPPEPLEGGVAEEPAGHDPMGTGAGPNDITDTERNRAELVASNFVLYAYGYTGDDHGEYTQNLNEVIVSPEFYSSPGAEHIGEVQQQIENGGTEGAAVLEEFDIAREGAGEIQGVAYFRTGEAYGEDGELSGETASYGQALNLVEWGETYRVQAADIREETQR